MKKIFFLLFTLLLSVSRPCFATRYSDDLLSLINLSRAAATQEHIAEMLGQPMRVEENNKRVWWHYNIDNTNLVICWNKRYDGLERFSFKNQDTQKSVFDNRVAKKLQSGTTNITQAIKLLGTPKEMKIKEYTQELHYAYQNSVLRLFFRDHILVDFTLLTQDNR